MNDFVIVLLDSKDKEKLEDFCEKKNLATFEFCQKVIVNALDKEDMQ